MADKIMAVLVYVVGVSALLFGSDFESKITLALVAILVLVFVQTYRSK